jgi:hypothetical protein
MEVMRWQNLVYIPIPKHASTSYRNIFTTIGFGFDDYSNINWQTDNVFSHICNPLTRHIKGVTEFLLRENLEHLINDSKCDRLLANCLFDVHNRPIGWTDLRFHASQIEWIPLDYPDISANHLTTRFLKINNIITDCNNFPVLHKNTQDNDYAYRKTTIESYIGKLHENPKYLDVISDLYKFDIELYHKVCQGPSRWLLTWESVSSS